MFKTGLKKQALQELEEAQKDYEVYCEKTQKNAEALFKVRQSTSQELIPEVEAYVNTLANTPKEFDKSFTEYRAEFTVFNNMGFWGFSRHRLQFAL